MYRYFLFISLISIFAVTANAQKLVYGGKPKAAVSTKISASHCADLPKGISVCKYTENPEDESKEPFGEIRIRQNLKTVGTTSAAPQGQTTSKDFFAFYGDLDKNRSAEIVVVEFTGQSNGLGVSYYSISIFPDFQTKGFQEPISFTTHEFGKDGTFVYDAKTNETLILVTDFGGLDNISKNGTYFVGRFFRYQNQMLKPATDKPVYARRYLNSFEKERYRTENSPLRPWLWLNTPKAQKFKTDPEFSLKPTKSQTGIVEKLETVKSDIVGEDGKVTEYLTTVQAVVKFSDGEQKTIVISDDSSYPTEASPNKIYIETFGIMPAAVSLPKDLDLKIVLGNLEGKRVLLNTYQPFEFDEEKRARYKLLFYE